MGATHLTLLLANYLTGVQNKHIAVLEWNGHGDFDRFGVQCLGLKKPADLYGILGASYVPRADEEALIQCMGGKYQVILLDCGRIEEGKRADLVRCRTKLIIGSFCEWQVQSYTPILRERKQPRDGWHYLTAFGSEESRQIAERRLKLPIERVPYIPDAYEVTKETISLFGRLLG